MQSSQLQLIPTSIGEYRVRYFVEGHVGSGEFLDFVSWEIPDEEWDLTQPLFDESYVDTFHFNGLR